MKRMTFIVIVLAMLLGCSERREYCEAYSDMGETPKAINSFQDAIDAADTTVTEFNFHQLSCV